jgi:hypothetical protein
MNISLLGKWRWKLIMEGDEMWRRVVVAKYGEDVVSNAFLEVANFKYGASVWWRDLCRIDEGGGLFKNVVNKKLGNGGSIRFWKDMWATNQSLENLFPRLFGILTQQHALVCDMGSWVDGVWRWYFLWRREFFVWEEALLQQLLIVIALKKLTNVDDCWEWIPAISDGFSVKSLYVYLDGTQLTHAQFSDCEYFAFRYIWKSGMPPKVVALAWQLLLNRIPTKDNLCYRGVMGPDDNVCSICAEKVETSIHLFLHCGFATNVWYSLNRWLGVMVILPPNLSLSYVMLVGSGTDKKRRKSYSLVWLAYIWVMWKTRNDLIFNNKAATVEEVVDFIQRTSWQWYLHNVAKVRPFFMNGFGIRGIVWCGE